MKYEILNIDIDYEKIGTKGTDYKPYLSVYIPDNSKEIDLNRKRPTVVICPGGGYSMTSDREAEPLAFKLLAADLNVIVVRFDVRPVQFPAQILEVAFAILKAREMAEEWNVDTEKIVVMGFSAGGHLAASYGNLWNKDFVKEYFGLKGGENKPNGMILGYPVIMSEGNEISRGNMINLLGDKINDKELLKLLSCEKQVSEDTPPAFIWHTFEDAVVTVENSLVMASALKEKNINTELHIFPHGRHGLSLCNSSVYKEYDGFASEVQCWIDMAIRWITNL
ncbi:MAG: alpha/beta hydrolase [Clostridia bacterium]|nr:alpha/beta hydrolase [Clostridia bacterium]